MRKLKTAILGLKHSGKLLLEAAGRAEHLTIQAVADKDTEIAESFAKQYNCNAFDDYRQLIIKGDLDCLMVSAGLHSCDEYVRASMKNKCHILKTAPAARNFEEAAELVRLAQDNNITYAIANPYRFSESFCDLADFVRQQKIEQPVMVEITGLFNKENCPAWHNDKKLAGGGVLLHNCYQLIDQLLVNFAMPQQIYSLTSNLAADRKQRLYLTEDNALISMKFGDSLIAGLKAVRHLSIDKDTQTMKIYGKNKILTVSDAEFIITDIKTNSSEKKIYSETELSRMDKVLENFALSILSPEEHKLCSSGSDNLKNMAVFEAAYLSAKTAMPEEPQRILQIEQAEMANIWPSRK